MRAQASSGRSLLQRELLSDKGHYGHMKKSHEPKGHYGKPKHDKPAPPKHEHKGHYGKPKAPKAHDHKGKYGKHG